MADGLIANKGENKKYKTANKQYLHRVFPVLTHLVECRRCGQIRQ